MKNRFKPDWASHPVETLDDWMKENEPVPGAIGIRCKFLAMMRDGDDTGAAQYAAHITFAPESFWMNRIAHFRRDERRLRRRRRFWHIIHNAIAHPLLATGARWAGRFHDWTAEKMS